MKKAGWQVKGIEINEKARNFSISHFGLEVITPDKISGYWSQTVLIVLLSGMFLNIFMILLNMFQKLTVY